MNSRTQTVIAILESVTYGLHTHKHTTVEEDQHTHNGTGQYTQDVFEN